MTTLIRQFQHEAEVKYPIKPRDCRLTRLRQEGLRSLYVKRKIEEWERINQQKPTHG